MAKFALFKITTLVIVLGGLLTAQEDFMGLNWHLQSITNSKGVTTEIKNPANYTLTLDESRSAAILADCNGCGGSYTYQRGSIDISVDACTMIYCGEESHDQTYLAALEGVTTLESKEDSLVLFSAEAGTLVFGQQKTGRPLAALLDKEWQLQYIDPQMGPPTRMIENPEDYTLQFSEDMTLTGQLDCNGCFGDYTADAVNLSIDGMGCTEIACGPESLDGEVGAYLQNVSSYSVTDTTLILYIMDFTGTQLHYKIPGRTGIHNSSLLPARTPEFGTLYIKPGQSIEIPEGFKLFDVTGKKNKGTRPAGGIWIIKQDLQEKK